MSLIIYNWLNNVKKVNCHKIENNIIRFYNYLHFKNNSNKVSVHTLTIKIIIRFKKINI